MVHVFHYAFLTRERIHVNLCIDFFLKFVKEIERHNYLPLSPQMNHLHYFGQVEAQYCLLCNFVVVWFLPLNYLKTEIHSYSRRKVCNHYLYLDFKFWDAISQTIISRRPCNKHTISIADCQWQDKQIISLLKDVLWINNDEICCSVFLLDCGGIVFNCKVMQSHFREYGQRLALWFEGEGESSFTLDRDEGCLPERSV